MEREQTGDEKFNPTVEKMRADVNEMEVRAKELGTLIEKPRSDWQSKQQDAGVPGAQPPTGEANEQSESEDESEELPSADAPAG